MSLKTCFLAAARLALAVLFPAACGGGSSSPGGTIDAGGGTPDAGLIPVEFRVTVPERTPAGSNIFVTGNFQGWDPGAPAYEMAPAGAQTYALTLSFPLHTQIEVKITRGSLATIETGVLGEEVQGRMFEVLEPTTITISVGGWADVSPSTIVGDVTQQHLATFLGGRRFWVYLPPGYHDSTARYPVLYMFDGQNVFDRLTAFVAEWKVDETLETLIPAGEVAPIIVVAIDHGGTQRISEYTPWVDPGNGGGGAAAHLAAIADVLVPYIDATYRTQTGPTHTGIAGSSLGGLMALYATYARPDRFGRNAALSPSIWWDSRHVVGYAAASAKPAARVWLDMGTDESSTAIEEVRAMRDAMVQQGFVLGTDLKVVEDPGAGHNEAAWSRRFRDTVKFLFPPN